MKYIINLITTSTYQFDSEADAVKFRKAINKAHPEVKVELITHFPQLPDESGVFRCGRCNELAPESGQRLRRLYGHDVYVCRMCSTDLPEVTP